MRHEIYVRELSTPAVEAWLDVGTYGIPELENCLFDVTCRHANDPRYQPGAAHVPGHTSQKATDEKHLRYPDASGRRVIALVHESWGRLGAEAEHVLALCAAALARREHRRGRLPGNPVRRWRAQLDADLHRALACKLHAAHHGDRSRGVRRLLPVDVAHIQCAATWPAPHSAN